MKKIIIIVLLLIFLSHPALAQTDTKALSLSDAIYADLAVRHYLDNVSLYYDNGNANSQIKLNEGRHWLPASTVKTFAAMYAYKLIANGKLNLYQTVAVDAKNVVPTEMVTEELPTLQEGDYVPISRLIRQMIIQSDNTAYNVLLDVLGRDNITTYIQSLGLIHSKVGSKLNLDTSQEQYEFDVPDYGINTTTAEDYALGFNLIKNQKITGAKDLFNVLKDQQINNMIPFYLPKDVICAHKTGDLNPLYHDGGICQDQKQAYVLTIFTNAGNTDLLAHLSELIYTKNYDLIGKTLESKPLSEVPEGHPLDPLVMVPVTPSVLGISNMASYFTPEITAADLGVTTNELSLVMNDKDLPHFFIPADSPWHGYSDVWQFVQKTLAFGQKAKLEADLSTAKLRLAEAKDLLKKGKTQEGQTILNQVQPILNRTIQITSAISNSKDQNTVAQISETRFAILADELKQSTGSARIALIKNIAGQAKEMVQKVQPNIPDAAHAANPNQRPLLGTVINTTATEVNVKTAGGQQIIIPLHNNSVVVEDKQNVSSASVSTSSATLSLSNLTTGSTVALLGSSTNNVFIPTLVLANVPQELAAPIPVTVAKVDTKHNTMVVVENGVYTQVNVNKNTNIKAADTNIPLAEIKAGDIVVVHGQPLTPMVQPISTPSATPVSSQTSTSSSAVSSPNNPSKSTSPTSGIQPATTNGSSITPALLPQTNQASSSVIAPIPSTGVTQKAIQTTQPVTPSPAPPKVIQSSTIKLIERKKDVVKPSVIPPSSMPKPQSAQPENKPPAVLPSFVPTSAKEEKKK